MFYLLAFLLCAFLAWACNELELIGWRRSATMHWTERARRLFPARVARGSNLWMLPLGATALTYRFYPEARPGLIFACGFAGTLLANYPMDRATLYGLEFRPWAHQVLATLLLKFSTLGIFAAAAYFMPAHFDWRMPAIAAAFLALVLAQQFGLTLRLMRLLRLLRPASPRLQAIVDETSAALGVRVRATWEMRRADANAVAFVTTKELGFTDGLLVFCPDDELRAICAHEIGHLSEDRLTVAGRLAGTLGFAPMIFARPAFAAWGINGVAGLALFMVAIVFVRPRLSRKLEKRADRIASGSPAGNIVYARALERIYQVNCVPAVIKKSGRGLTHPNLYDRMVDTGVTPAYPRPAPPNAHGVTGLVISVLSVFAAMSVFGRF
jgi:Zn-dependent protease with chaperone function